MTSIGDHGARVFSRLVYAGELHIDARDLPRGLVSEHPDLAERRLQGSIVRAPRPMVDAVQAAFAPVRRDPIEPPAASPLSAATTPRWSAYSWGS
jgi:hypothetical protein